jgi:hypothetical protein
MWSPDSDETVHETGGNEDLLEERKARRRSHWNSLEVARFMVSLLTPALLLLVGYTINDSQRKSQQNFEATQRENQRNFEERQRLGGRLIEKRIDIYDLVGPKLNDMLCYVNRLGHWKELKPPDLIANKRLMDRTMYTYRPMFSEKLFSSYIKFIDSAYQFHGKDKVTGNAKLRTSIDYRPEGAEKTGYAWKSEWTNHFTGEDNSGEVTSSYKELMDAFAAELGMKP